MARSLFFTFFFSPLLSQVNPLRVILTQKLIEDIYNFIFPPSHVHSSKEALAVVNPRLPAPDTSRLASEKDAIIAKTVEVGSQTVPASSSTQQRDSSSHTSDSFIPFVYLKFLRVAPIVAQVDYTGSALNLQVCPSVI